MLPVVDHFRLSHDLWPNVQQLYIIRDEKSVMIHHWNQPGISQRKVLIKVQLTPFGSLHLTQNLTYLCEGGRACVIHRTRQAKALSMFSERSVVLQRPIHARDYW